MTKLSTERHAQRARLLDYLFANSRITTLEARERLDVMHPAARVQELRGKGHNIVTQRIWQETEQGRHRVAEYVLLSGGPVNG